MLVKASEDQVMVIPVKGEEADLILVVMAIPLKGEEADLIQVGVVPLLFHQCLETTQKYPKFMCK